MTETLTRGSGPCSSRSMRSIGRPGVDAPAEAVDEFEIFALVMLGLALGDGRLAEQIDGEGQRPPPQSSDGAECFVEVGAGDEASRQCARRTSGPSSASSAPSRPCSAASASPCESSAGSVFAGLAEVLAQVAGDVGRRTQQRQDIDEAEQLHLDRLVAHRPFHEAFVPPGGRERKRPVAVQPGEDFAAVIVRQRFHIHRDRHEATPPLTLCATLILAGRPCPRAV